MASHTENNRRNASIEPHQGLRRILAISERPDQWPKQSPAPTRPKRTAAARVFEAAERLLKAAVAVCVAVSVGAWISAALWPLAVMVVASLWFIFASDIILSTLVLSYITIVIVLLVSTTIDLIAPEHETPLEILRDSSKNQIKWTTLAIWYAAILFAPLVVLPLIIFLVLNLPQADSNGFRIILFR